MFGEITKAGFFIFWMTEAIVNVLPDPVTPKSTWFLSPVFKLASKFLIALG